MKKSAASIKFATNHYGKPYVDCSANLQFNLSHSSNLGLLAVGWKYSLGIDLEFFSLRDYRGIAKHSFSSQELKDFYSLPAYYQPYSFFHIWAQKEAFIKATGLGLSYGLQEFDVSCWPVPQFFLVDKIDKKPWKIIPFMPKIACTGAICCHELIKTIRYQLISYEQLTL